MYTLIMLGFVYLSTFTIIVPDFHYKEDCMRAGHVTAQQLRKISNNRDTNLNWVCVSMKEGRK